MHTKKHLRKWFKTEYKPALEYTQIKSKKYIHNIDKKGAWIACLAKEEVVVLIRIKEMYVGVPENRLSLTIVKFISVNGKAILPLVIVPSVTIMVSWFHENITGHKIVTVSLTKYTNKRICII